MSLRLLSRRFALFRFVLTSSVGQERVDRFEEARFLEFESGQVHHERLLQIREELKPLVLLNQARLKCLSDLLRKCVQFAQLVVIT